MADSNAPKPLQKRRRWRFFSAAAVILALACIGDFVGRQSGDLPRRLAAGGGLERNDWLVLAFLASSTGWAILSRRAVLGFFRSMHVGVTLIVICVVGVVIGVLIPQISGFEDPLARVGPKELAGHHATSEAGYHLRDYEEEYSAFRWAEGYFLYHLIHLYGLGMPEADIPPGAEAGLDRFGQRYGFEERDNSRKRMEAALSGQAKTREISAFIAKHDGKLRWAFDWATRLHFNRAYRSGWFATLVSLLGFAILCNTFTGKPSSWLSVRRAGFFVTHIGMLVMLLGGGVSKLLTKRGILHLDLRDAPQNEFWLNFDRNQPEQMPFHLKLERFARKEWKQIQVEFPNENFRTRPPSWTVWPGWERDLDYVDDGAGGMRPRLRLEVRGVAERARVEMDLREATSETERGVVGPVAELDVHALESTGSDAPRRVTRQAAIVPGISQFRYYIDPEWEFRLGASFGDESPSELTERFPADEQTVGVLWARDEVRSGADFQALKARVGDVLEVEGGYRVEILRAMANYAKDRDTGNPVSAAGYPASPALVVEITTEDGRREQRLVRQDIDAVDAGLQGDYIVPSLELAFAWDEWYGPGPPRYLLHWNGAGEAMLVPESGSSEPVTPVTIGEPLPIPARAQVVPRDLLVAAVLDRETVFEEPVASVAGEVDEDFYVRSDKGLLLAITHDPGTPEETSDVVKLVSDGELASLWSSDDGRVRLGFFENTSLMPYEWRSVLSVGDMDEHGHFIPDEVGTEREREIRVNDYFNWKGYRFFQTNADADFPTYSGIGVVYDPGIPVVLVGMYTIIAGTVLSFIIRPLAGRREGHTVVRSEA